MIDRLDTRNFMKACLKFERQKQTPDAKIIGALELLKDHYYTQDEGSQDNDIEIIAEVEMPPHGINFVPEHPNDYRLPVDIED